MLIQEEFEQVQAELEETQVAAIGAMNDLDPIVPLGNHAQIDDPDIGQASCDHQAGQARRVQDVAFVQVEPPALLVGEEDFNPESFGVPVTRFFDQFYVGDQIDRLFVSSLSPGDGQYRSVVLKGEGHIGQTKAFSLLYTYLVEGKPFAFCPQLGVLGRATGRMPCVAIDGGLEGNAIELPVTDEDNINSLRHYLVDLLLHVGLFREMALVALHDDPRNGQGSFLVDRADHQGQALPSIARSSVRWSARLSNNASAQGRK